MAKDEMSSDAIEALLRADEQELRAKRGRLRAFARSVEQAREAISAAQEAASEVRDRDGLTRADLARTFGLSDAERALLVPTKRRSNRAQHENGSLGDEEGLESKPGQPSENREEEPDDRLE